MAYPIKVLSKGHGVRILSDKNKFIIQKCYIVS